jgi:hypothetical protein
MRLRSLTNVTPQAFFQDQMARIAVEGRLSTKNTGSGLKPLRHSLENTHSELIHQEEDELQYLRPELAAAIVEKTRASMNAGNPAQCRIPV